MKKELVVIHQIGKEKYTIKFSDKPSYTKSELRQILGLLDNAIV